MDGVAAGRPWWYLGTRTMWQSTALGGGLTATGLVGLVYYSLGVGHIGDMFFSLGQLVIGSIYLASTAVRYRRERSRGGSRTAVPPGLPPSS